MQSTVGKWGNSLAIRLPVEFARQSGLREGVPVELSVTAQGELRVAMADGFNKAAFLKKVAQIHAHAAKTPSVIRALRNEARY